jgi:selenocysteine lyase/cysteine desulfurase
MNKEQIEIFRKARRLFPVTSKDNGIIFFNSASTGPLSNLVIRRLEEYNRLAQHQNRNMDRPAFEALARIRKLGAKFLKARRDEIGFGFNTGYGLNIAAFGLPLKKGDEVLLSDIEFPSNVYPWMALRERGIKVKFIKSVDNFFSIDEFKESISKKSRVLSLSFVQFFNGFKNDLKTIGKICRDGGLYFVVDGIQGCGVEPVDVKKWNVDFFSAGAQKWMLAPQGSGIFYIKKDLQEKLHRPFASWLGVDWKLRFGDLFRYNLPFFDSARGFEMGSYPYDHVHALDESLTLIDSLGVRNIQRHNHELIDHLVDFLKSDRRYRLKSSLVRKHRSSILAFNCDNVKIVHRKLIKNGIICSLREGAIRIAVHLYNDISDINRLIRLLKQ